MKKKRINYAVSELVGVVLLLAIVTSVMALIFYQLSSDKGPHKQAFVKLVGKIEVVSIPHCTHTLNEIVKKNRNLY